MLRHHRPVERSGGRKGCVPGLKRNYVRGGPQAMPRTYPLPPHSEIERVKQQLNLEAGARVMLRQRALSKITGVRHVDR